MTAEFSDVSHWQSTVRFDRYKDHEIGLKATDYVGGNVVDSTYIGRVTQAHKRGIAVHHYDFGRHGDVATQAAFFVRTVRPHWKAGDFATIDCEAAGFNGADAKVWQDTVHKMEPSWQLEIYGGPYFLRDNHIRPRHGALLWLAEYAAKIAFIPPGWKTWHRWQFTSGASIPAISGKSDRSKINPAVKHPKPKPKKPGKTPKPKTKPGKRSPAELLAWVKRTKAKALAGAVTTAVAAYVRAGIASHSAVTTHGAEQAAGAAILAFLSVHYTTNQDE